MKTTRVWVACAILLCLLYAVTFGAGQVSAAASTSDNPMGYINPDAQLVSYPDYKGKTYEDKVPDTIDITEMAKLAINALTGLADPDADYGMYFGTYFLHDPAFLTHSEADSCQCKFMEALPLLRVASGSDLNKQVDKVWMESLLKSIGPDGLYYMPGQGWPWTRPEGMKPDDPAYMQRGRVFQIGRLLGVMGIYYLRDKNPMWLQIGNRMVDRLGELCVYRDDYACVPIESYFPGVKVEVSPDAELPKGCGIGDSMGRVPEGLAKYYRLSGYEPAKELAGKLARYMRYHANCFDDQGRSVGRNGRDANGGIDVEAHFHVHTTDLLAMVEYATAAGDREMAEFVDKSFRWFVTQGSDLTGFFPELLMVDDSPNIYGNGCESCQVADMIALAVKLTDAGTGDYWDNIDRWVRNQFAENQLTNIDWIKGFSVASGDPSPIGKYDTSDRAAERSLGAFASGASPNDFASPYLVEARTSGGGLMNCCIGNAARSIYYVWERVLDAKDGRLRLNLLMNRASEWADVYSYIPYEGKVDLKIKKSFRNVLVRMPEWVSTSDIMVVCMVNGKPRSFKPEGRYIDVGSVKTGDKVTVSFPIHEWTTCTRIGGKRFNLVLRGNTVVSIDPPGVNCPTYQRDKYRKNKADWKTVRRFLSDERLEW